MKIFITGADGALGKEMQQVLHKNSINCVASDLNQLDIADFKKTNESLLKHRPDIILHFAAISNVDYCEENKDLAFHVNALGTYGLAIIAKKINAKILYVSTNYVFDGSQEKPYLEHNATAPINEYGKTKLIGENYIKELCPRYFIVRTSWLFGKGSKNYVPKFIADDKKSVSINVICDQFASFTYILDLAEAILLLLKSENYGTYHLTNRGVGSWLDFGLEAKELMKFKTELNPIKVKELNLAALRPRFAPLASKNFEFFFKQNLRSWKDGLAEYIKSIQKLRTK